MNVKHVAKDKSITAAIAALISVLYTAETAWADYHLTPCDSAQPGGSATARTEDKSYVLMGALGSRPATARSR